MGSRTSSKPETTKLNSSKGAAVALLFAATVVFLIAREGSAEEALSDVKVEGGWAYTEKSKDGEVEHVAASRAAEDAVWLTVACAADGRLTVSFAHSEQFPFPLKPLFFVKLHSNNVPTAIFEAKSIESNQIFVAPLLMRHILPLLMQENEIVVSIPERGGAVHNYTFSMQPHDLALRPIRPCFDF